MRVIETISGFREAYASAVKPLGLVPTMGFLHEGHISLVKRARDENATVTVSIFVNPTQFAADEDFSTYPRNMDADLDMLRSAGVDLVFAPNPSEIYPPGFETQVDVGDIGSKLEGEHRPGHFIGVATVVCKLLTIVRPDKVYFGQKDAQQCLVIQRLNADLNLGAEVVVCPTVREPDGLAMSSRNVNLSPEEREAASVLYRALCKAKSLRDEGVTYGEEIRQEMRQIIYEAPSASIDYVSLADSNSLEELQEVTEPALASLAMQIGNTRLIDNMMV
jgi:pantoate--beta-alanine ligase